jgi:hypothetical protein
MQGQGTGTKGVPIIRQIPDKDGKEHQYAYHLHGGREGLRLLARLSKMLGKAGGVLASAVSTLEPSQGKPQEGTEDGGIQEAGGNGAGLEIAAGMHLDRIGAALGIFAGELIAEGADSLLDEIFKFAVRDGQPVREVFDQAYQGNIGEAITAAGHVIMDNFGKALSAPLSGMLGKVGLPVAHGPKG